MKIDLSNFWSTIGAPPPIAEYKFHPSRKWRFDYAWPDYLIAVEVEGGIWIAGRHNRPFTMIKDMEKYNEAAWLGWKVFRFTPQQFKGGEAAEYLERAFRIFVRHEK